MALATQIAADSAALVNSDDFAESVTYTPDGGAPIAIDAIIERHPIAPEGSSRQVAKNDVDLWIRNHATLGIVTPGRRDKVDIAPEYGGTPVEHRVAEVVDGDAGVWHLVAVQ